MLIKEQATIYLDGLAERKRSPVKPATLDVYKSLINTWILPELGDLNIKRVENGKMKQFVGKLSLAGLSASSINSIANCVKAIIKSAVDDNGNVIYTRTWNNEFIDIPLIDKKSQSAPIIAREAVQEAIRHAPEQFKPLYAILAGTGVRIGEALALRRNPVIGKSFYSPERSLIVINSTIYNHLEQTPKTPAAIREIDVPKPLNDYLKQKSPKQDFWFTNTAGRCYNTDDGGLRLQAEKNNIPGFHSFRRFRRTHLEIENVPAGLCDFWLGHEGKEISSRYIKFGEKVEERKIWAQKAGLGFDL